MNEQLNVSETVERLRAEGLVMLPGYVEPAQLKEMQEAFRSRLERLRANNIDGYEKTERFRDMIEDVLLLDQGFLDLALDSFLLEVIREYVGDGFQLVEAKGWRSRPTQRDWHGWHGDAWYDQKLVTEEIPPEIKLVLYLTDVRSGGLKYIPGSHRKLAPRPFSSAAAKHESSENSVHITGPAGTIALFDTSGIHRQSEPILEPREAVFYCYHDPKYPLQPEDVAYHRYHPLLLNAAFLADLSAESQRVLGFGDKRQYIPQHKRRIRHPGIHRLFRMTLESALWFDDVFEPAIRRVRKIRTRLTRRK